MHLKDLSQPSTQTVITYLHHLHYLNDLHHIFVQNVGAKYRCQPSNRRWYAWVVRAKRGPNRIP
jgi:hypothetical protein